MIEEMQVNPTIKAYTKLNENIEKGRQDAIEFYLKHKVEEFKDAPGNNINLNILDNGSLTQSIDTLLKAYKTISSDNSNIVEGEVIPPQQQ